MEDGITTLDMTLDLDGRIPALTTKYGRIGRIPPRRNAPNITKAPFNGLPRISKSKNE